MQTARAVVGISLLLGVLLPIGCGTVSPSTAQEKKEKNELLGIVAGLKADIVAR